MSEQSQNIEAAALADRKILVVDDEQGITLLIGETLTRCGADVTRAGGGTEAVQELRRQRFDLVLLDLVMPQVDGWAVLEFIKEQYPQLMARTVLMTGDRYHVETVQHIHRMQIPSIFKPFDLDNLRVVLGRALISAGAARSLSAA
jgi:two-component system response regulator (stage 0 sporulation protein F)